MKFKIELDLLQRARMLATLRATLATYEAIAIQLPDSVAQLIADTKELIQIVDASTAILKEVKE